METLAATESAVVSVEGMSCSACVARIKRSLAKLEGVGEADVSLEERVARVAYDPRRVTPEKVAVFIADLGYKTQLRDQESAQ
jgi:copper chaperone CopZ